MRSSPLQGLQKTWLQESAPAETWGIGCKLCRAFAFANGGEQPEVDTPFVKLTKGSGNSLLQLEDLLRHGGQARKSAARSKFHQRAIDWHVGGTAQLPHAGEISLPLSWKQLLTSVEVCHSPLASQGGEYQRRCMEAYKCNPQLCPLARSSRSCHAQIISAVAEVLFDRDRTRLKEAVLSIGLAQALADMRGLY